ncbi:MAG: TraB/GumN family protein [Woeseiaceae bacterium]|nr:TraB/GumN family protein [Woeseiaceae bacterium]
MLRHFFLAALAVLPGIAIADGQPVTMWLAQGESNRIYILGSVHLLRPQDHPLPGALEAAYDDAEALIMELDMDDLDATRIQALTNQLGVIQDERTLRDFMAPTDYEQAARAAADLDIPFDMLQKTEPWFAAVTIEQLVLMRLGFNPMYGVEMHMTMKATQDGKSIEGLETIDEQLSFLDGLSHEAQIDLLLQTLAEGGNVASMMDDMIRAWRDGDIAYLEKNMLDDMSQYPELFDVIVSRRNQRWVRSIEELLDDDDDYLIIVGALHLIGDIGVPALLARRGVRIRQVE